MRTSLYWSVQVVGAIEWACALCGHHIQNDWVSRAMNLHQICVKLEYSSAETIWMIQRAAAMGNRWLAASLQQDTCSCITSCAEFLVKYQIIQVTQPPCSPDLVPCNLWLFPKLKSPLKGKRFQTTNEIQEKNDGAADGDWENRVRSQGAYFEGDWGIIVLYAIFLVSCIFFNVCFSYYMVVYFLDITNKM